MQKPTSEKTPWLKVSARKWRIGEIMRNPKPIEICITGWWLTYPSEKYELVSWEYEMSNLWKVI